MTAREELAQSIAANLDRVFLGKREFGPATQDYELADALLAEGWGKLADARAAELEAAAVVIDEDQYDCYDAYYAEWLRARAATIRSQP